MASITNIDVSSNKLSFQEFSEQVNEVLPSAIKNNLAHYPKELLDQMRSVKILSREITNLRKRVKNLAKKEKRKCEQQVSQKSVKLRMAKEKVVKMKQKMMREYYKLYSNSFKAELPILLGTADLRSPRGRDELLNFGVLSGGNSPCSETLLDDFPDVQTGSILWDRNWTVLKNDSFMLGAIHSQKTVYVHGKLEDVDLWDGGESRPRVLGREIAMLSRVGYTQVATEKQIEEYGPTLVCLDSEKASNAKMKSLIEIAQKVDSIDQIKEILSPAERS